ncbi:MAG: hypothetical protein C7B43_16460 [Sulfobacillus benefaciens]|uniref:Uncharacterized protein n=1 Tax=Sulfobacillus benefaciens TaxID=453960 RepID=A0A2T2WTR8_9FIRM|nr:MAG: hypothetical protein C7B43_16460 [Sulfobacillus benefaciens]
MMENPRVKTTFNQDIELLTRTRLSVREAQDLVTDLLAKLAEVSDIGEIVALAKTLYQQGGNH